MYLFSEAFSLLISPILPIDDGDGDVCYILLFIKTQLSVSYISFYVYAYNLYAFPFK